MVRDWILFLFKITVPSSDSSAKISLRVHPSASRNEVAGFSDGVWHIRVAAPPVKGKANKELTDFLGQLLNVGKSRIAIIRGHATRNKVITIDGLSQEEVINRLSFSCGGARGRDQGQSPKQG